MATPEIPVTFPPGRDRLSTQSGSDRVSAGRADDRDFACCLLGGSCSGREPGHDHIDFEAYQFRCQRRKAVDLSFVRTELEMNVLPIDVTKVAQCFGK